MSTVLERESATAETDPFRLGWRHVTITHPDGSTDLDTIPLTPDDVLHPQEGDHIVQNDFHHDDCEYLYGALKAWCKDIPDSLVLGDCQVDLGLPNERPICPDISVVFGARKITGPWSCYNVAIEKVPPILVMEVLSKSTWENDVGKKVDWYYRADVRYYVIVGRVDGDLETIKFTGYKHGRNGYERIPLDARGWLWLEPVQLWLGTAGPDLALYTKAGEKYYDYAGEVMARIAAEAKAREAVEARTAAEAKAREAVEARTATEAKAREGRNATRKLLSKLAQKRFGSPSAMITDALEAVDDLERLERMGDRVDEVSNWQELLDTP